jgi:hypothetical protein
MARHFDDDAKALVHGMGLRNRASVLPRSDRACAFAVASPPGIAQ